MQVCYQSLLLLQVVKVTLWENDVLLFYLQGHDSNRNMTLSTSFPCSMVLYQCLTVNGILPQYLLSTEVTSQVVSFYLLCLGIIRYLCMIRHFSLADGLTQTPSYDDLGDVPICKTTTATFTPILPRTQAWISAKAFIQIEQFTQVLILAFSTFNAENRLV